ncbi:MAG: hypothetical protein LBM70_04490 [Victivallales bacterium]|jgi:hypothetical protein|nr:hypothetical protein [Victivallales bacterium]
MRFFTLICGLAVALSIVVVNGEEQKNEAAKPSTVLFSGKPKISPWGKASGVVLTDRIEVKISAESSNWCGVNIVFPQLAVPAGATKLTYEVNGGIDTQGNRGVPTPYQVCLITRNASGDDLKSSFATPKVKLDADSESWQKVELPLLTLLPKDAATIRGVKVQFKILPAERFGIEVRNFRLE